MQLNGPHTDHEHASVSLKVLLLIFGLILIAVLGYFVWLQNADSDTTETPAPSVKQEATTETTTATDETAEWKTYSNSMFGLSFKYPSDWNIDSSTLEESASIAQGIETGRTHVTVYQGDRDNMTKKIELSFGETDSTSVDQVASEDETSSHTEISRSKVNNINWLLTKVNIFKDSANQGVTAYGHLSKQWSGLTKTNTRITVTGYYFTGIESSKYDENIKTAVEAMLKTVSIK